VVEKQEERDEETAWDNLTLW